jgi:hypothetical protein
MANYPTMIILRDANDMSISAKCSECGEEMPLSESRLTTKELNLKWFQQQFAFHRQQKHTHLVK